MSSGFWDPQLNFPPASRRMNASNGNTANEIANEEKTPPPSPPQPSSIVLCHFNAVPLSMFYHKL